MPTLASYSFRLPHARAHRRLSGSRILILVSPALLIAALLLFAVGGSSFSSSAHYPSSVPVEATRPDSTTQAALKISRHAARAANLSRTSSEIDAATRARVNEAYGKLPLSFEAVQGQGGKRINFQSRGGGYHLALAPDEAVLTLHRRVEHPANHQDELKDEKQIPSASSTPQPIASETLRLKIVGGNREAQMTGEDELPGKINYFIGNDSQKWRTNVRTYARVKYDAVYQGIDLVYYGNQRQLEYDFIIAPGADPDKIKLGLDAQHKMLIDAQGDLVIRTANGGDLRQPKPFTYQERDGVRREISSRYVIKSGHEIGFQIGSYDHSLPLVVDPTLVYSTYLGGDGSDQAYGIALDAGGSAYVTGRTSAYNFPLVNPLPYPSFASEAFVTKFNPSGSALIYSTYLGGSDHDDGAYSIAVDGSGNACITGYTYSRTFPTVNAIQPTFGDTNYTGDAFVAKLNAAGSALIYSTYLGGVGSDGGYSIALDSADNAYVAGSTYSSNFPTVNALQANRKGSAAFKSIDGGGSWQANNNGLNAGYVYSLAIDPTNPSTIYAGGDTGLYKSIDSGGHWTPSVINSDPNFREIHALALDPTAPNTIYAGTGYSGVYKSVDGGNSWSSGSAPDNTNQSWVFSLAVNPGTPSTILSGTYYGIYKSLDGGIHWSGTNISNRRITAIAFNPTNPSIVYAGASTGANPTFYKSLDGGNSWNGINYLQNIYSIAVDRTNPSTIYVGASLGVFKSVNGGSTFSSSNNGLFGGTANFVTIDPNVPTTLYATRRGGGLVFKSIDSGNNWSAINNGLGGSSVECLAINPANSSEIQVGTFTGWDAFITKFNPSGSALVYSTFHGGDNSDFANGIAVDASNQVYVIGNTTSPNFPTLNPLQATFKGFTDAYVSKLKADGSGFVYSTFLGGNDDDSGKSIAVDAEGSAYLTGNTFSNNFPTVNPLQANLNGYRDAFVAKLNPAGSALVYSTYLGGSDLDVGNSIALDAGGNAYVTGFSSSTNFPTVNAIQPSFNGLADAFITKLNANGSAFLYSTFLGGSDDDEGTGIAVDSTGKVHVTGFTQSYDFPTINPFQPVKKVNYEAFVARIVPTGDLSLSIAAPASVAVGNNLTYTITVSNGAELAATGVTVTNTIPAGTNFVSASASQGTCSGTSVVTCNLGGIGKSATATVTIVVAPQAVGTINDTATVSGNEPDANTANNSGTRSTTVTAPVSNTQLTLLTEENSNQAIALDSVTMQRGPFSLINPNNFSADHRTRISLFAWNLALPPGNNASSITALAEDSQHRVYPVLVEYAASVPGFDWLNQINIKLPDELAGAGDIFVNINAQGAASNKVVIKIQ